MVYCYFCNEEMIWQNDFDYADVYGEGEGIVSFYKSLIHSVKQTRSSPGATTKKNKVIKH